MAVRFLVDVAGTCDAFWPSDEGVRRFAEMVRAHDADATPDTERYRARLRRIARIVSPSGKLAVQKAVEEAAAHEAAASRARRARESNFRDAVQRPLVRERLWSGSSLDTRKVRGTRAAPADPTGAGTHAGARYATFMAQQRLARSGADYRRVAS